MNYLFTIISDFIGKPERCGFDRIRLLELFILLMFVSTPFKILADEKSPFCPTYGFYTGKNYGSEYRFNPLNMMLNGGFDIFQGRPGNDHNIFRIPYQSSHGTIWKNFSHPVDAVKYTGGWKNFLETEVFPMTFDKRAKWPPNYSLHLIGGGIIYGSLVDYFNYYNIPAPHFFAFTSYYAYHWLNEVVENGYYKGRTIDPVADLWIFDLLAPFLVSIEPVKNLYKSLNMANWDMQPSFMFPDKSLENVGQYFSLKWKFPFFDNRHYHLFVYWGMNEIFGLSYKWDNGMALSFGFGTRTKRLVVVNLVGAGKTVSMVYSGGIFLDKYNSLLASLIVNFNYDQLLQFNFYPGWMKIEEVSPGLWVSVSPKGRIMAGIVINWLPGIGYKDPKFYKTDYTHNIKKLQ